MFMWLIGAILFLMLLGGGIAALVLGIVGLLHKWEPNDDVVVARTFSAISVLGGLLAILFAGAIITGGISGGYADGCYRLVTHLVGKTQVQDYNPIPCPVGY
jgi:hypothetical protein